MANLYVRSTDGSDADNGTTWALAKATLAGALAIAAAGDTIFVSQAHAETQATAMTLTSPGTAAAPVRVLCANDGAEPPTALATTATISTTNNSSISTTGYLYVYGIAFGIAGGSNANINFNNTASAAGVVCEACAFNVAATGTGCRVRFGVTGGTQTASQAVLINCTISFAATGQGLEPLAAFEMRGGSIAETGTVPTTMVLLTSNPSAPGPRFIGVNLSAFGSGKSLVTVASGRWLARFEHCKLGASVALTTGSNQGPGGPAVFLDNCDSGDTNYRMQRHSYEGDVYSETTIVRTGGASDGTTPLAWKMVSSANRVLFDPLYSPEFVVWNSVVGQSVTVIVEILHDSATAVKDDEVWLEVEALATAGFPLATFASDRVATILTAGADQDASQDTPWVTTGLSNPNKQRLAVTITPQEVGWIRGRVAVAKASYTVYVNPKALVS